MRFPPGWHPLAPRMLWPELTHLMQSLSKLLHGLLDLSLLGQRTTSSITHQCCAIGLAMAACLQACCVAGGGGALVARAALCTAINGAECRPQHVREEVTGVALQARWTGTKSSMRIQAELSRERKRDRAEPGATGGAGVAVALVRLRLCQQAATREQAARGRREAKSAAAWVNQGANLLAAVRW